MGTLATWRRRSTWRRWWARRTGSCWGQGFSTRWPKGQGWRGPRYLNAARALGSPADAGGFALTRRGPLTRPPLLAEGVHATQRPARGAPVFAPRPVVPPARGDWRGSAALGPGVPECEGFQAPPPHVGRASARRRCAP